MARTVRDRSEVVAETEDETMSGTAVRDRLVRMFGGLLVVLVVWLVAGPGGI